MSDSPQGGHRPGFRDGRPLRHSGGFRSRGRGPYSIPGGGHRQGFRDDRPVQHSSRDRPGGPSYGSNNTFEGGHRGRPQGHSSRFGSRGRGPYNDGGQGPSARDQLPETYSTRKGAATQDGTDFEIKMCALVFLRAVQCNSIFTNFKMRSNDRNAGDFDDIVFSYGSPGKEQNILVQLKTSKRSINLDPPVKKSPKKSLKSHFQSLDKANTSQYFKNNCTYVFFTNADVDLPPTVENVDSAVKPLLCTAWKPDNVRQVDLIDDVCKGLSAAKQLLCTAWKSGNVRQVDLADEVCKGFRNDTGAGDFVKRLLILRNQCGPKYLDELIKQELIKMCNGFVPGCRAIQQIFVEKIKAWWGQETKAALDENFEQWTELKKQLLGQNTLLKQIKFCEDTLSNLEHGVLGSKSDIKLLKSDSAEAQIACSKVYQTFIRRETLQVLFTDLSEPQESQDMLFCLWSKGDCDVLVITDVTNCCQNLADNIANYKCNTEKQNKKIIVIVSSTDADKLGLSQVDEFVTDFIKSTFKQLDGNSQDILRNLAVDFQGKGIALGKIMTDTILEGGILQYVLTSPKIQIGSALPPRNDKYIPRTLSKTFDVTEYIFRSDEKFYVGGIEQDYLNWRATIKRGGDIWDKRIYSNEPLYRIIGMTRRELYEEISGFKCCEEILPEGPEHFLEVFNSTLYWIHSHGSTDDLVRFIRFYRREKEDCKKLIRDTKSRLVKEEDLVRKEFQRVIVADEPGSGKTALFVEVANTMKELNPVRWVTYIDLNKHSATLDEMKQVGNITRENVLDLLSKAADLSDCELSKQLLKYSVLESGDICILFDAFDEIAPTYTDTVLVILKLILREFKLSTLWIASRYNMRETLEEELESCCFRIEPLSDEEQVDFMSKHWGIEKAKKFHKIIFDKLPFGIRSFPLHIKMMCEIYSDVNMSDNFQRMSTPSDVAKLYEQFIEKKFDIYCKEKCNLNSPSAAIEEVKKNLRKRFMERHTLCSFRVLELDYSADDDVRDSIQDMASDVCETVRECNERLGVIDGIVDDEPHFMHKTFAEFFAGKWLAEHWEKNRDMLYTVFTDRKYQFLNKILSLELDRELPVHLAVLTQDIKALKRLREEDLKQNLKQTDVIGRTPLHLAAMMVGGKASNVMSKLLKCGPDLEICDGLGYTPMFYAQWLNNEEVVRILHEHGAEEKVVRKSLGNGYTVVSAK